MNNVYFACGTCRVYHDAGYRWSYWALEHPGIIRRTEPVSVEAVLNASEYWEGTSEPWLAELLPRVRSFLVSHREHEPAYGDWEEIIGDLNFESMVFMDWIEESGLACQHSCSLTPRAFVERLGLRSWSEVAGYISDRPQMKPWWWGERGVEERARERFEWYVRNAFPAESSPDPRNHGPS